jgi:hypothetical protein
VFLGRFNETVPVGATPLMIIVLTIFAFHFCFNLYKYSHHACCLFGAVISRRRGRKEFRFWLFNDKILYGEGTGLGTYRPSREILLTQSRVTAATVGGEPVMRIESPAKSFDVWMK